jgi:bifunctional non-homologous end joining protein LigD
VVPLNPGCPWSMVKPFARTVATSLAADEPARYVAAPSKSLRNGRIFLDYLRNDRGSTSVASFSLRARPGAPVAVPLSWDEVDKLKRADAFDIESLPARLARLASDPWERITEVEQDLHSVSRKLEQHAHR